jgi:hypothetical protein
VECVNVCGDMLIAVALKAGRSVFQMGMMARLKTECAVSIKKSCSSD